MISKIFTFKLHSNSVQQRKLPGSIGHSCSIPNYEKNRFLYISAKGECNKNVIIIFQASQNDLRFKVSAKDILIKVDPALFSKQFYGEFGIIIMGLPSTESNYSSVESRFPPTRTLSVQWTENLGNLEKAINFGRSLI